MNVVVEFGAYQKRVELYLRALWGKRFDLHSYETKLSTPFSYVENNSIVLPGVAPPAVFQDLYYRAASTHAACHLMYGMDPFEKRDLNLMQRTMVGLVEDLRVELLAISQFPGLKKLWLLFHHIDYNQSVSAQNLISRLSRSVLDDDYDDDHGWVKKGKRLISDNAVNIDASSFSMITGLHLANDLGQMRLPLNSGRYEQAIIYRDDNRILWNEIIDISQHDSVAEDEHTTVLHHKHYVEGNDGRQLTISDQNPGRGEGLFVEQSDEPDFEYCQEEFQDSSVLFMYPEWDYRSRILKKDWCSLFERQPFIPSIQKVDEIYETYRNTIAHLRKVARYLYAAHHERVRKLEEGDDLDLDPVINAMVSIRSCNKPDSRVFMRNEYRHTKSLAISILMDLSASTNDTVGGHCINHMMRDAVFLLGETLSIIDDDFSIFGFSSNSRQEVNFIVYKSFKESFDTCKMYLSDITGQHSTRLGAAIRHSGYYLAQQPADKKLLLVITDGAPSDVDIFDPHYLEYDSREAVQSLARLGLKTFCLNLDGKSDRIIEHIFGKDRYETMTRLDNLPTLLTKMYLKHLRY